VPVDPDPRRQICPFKRRKNEDKLYDDVLSGGVESFPRAYENIKGNFFLILFTKKET
jgi:hypothetical protein